MILKCTREQFEAMHRLFAQIMQNDTGTIVNSLTLDLMRPIYQKLDSRVKARLNGNKGWNLSLTDIQAKTYYSFFDGVNLGQGYLYEMIIIQKHLTEINRIHG